jgi:hypothetical protein
MEARSLAVIEGRMIQDPSIVPKPHWSVCMPMVITLDFELRALCIYDGCFVTVGLRRLWQIDRLAAVRIKVCALSTKSFDS